MKRFLLVVGILSITALTLGVAGFAYAQNQTPPNPDHPYGPGMMRNYGDYGRGYWHGMMGEFGRGYGRGMMDWNSGYGPMHEWMVAALAERLGVPTDEIEARHAAGESMWEIAQSEGLSVDEIQDLMFSAHDKALEDAVANGWMTEEQAKWMDAHMDQMWSGDFENGAFGGHCGGGGRYNNSRWQDQN